MAALRKTVFFFILVQLLFSKIASKIVSEPHDSSHEYEIQQLKTKIEFLELSIDEKTLELRNKDERISQVETVIQEKADIIASLQSEIEYLQQKRSSEGKEHMSNTCIPVSELEKQVDKLQKEIEVQNKKKNALEVRANIVEGKIHELNLKLENLERINNEQKTRIRLAEHALRVAQEELVEAKLQEVSTSYKIHGEQIPRWLAVHTHHFQSYLISCWNEHGRPALDMTIQKIVEKKAQFAKWAEPHIESMKTEWIPMIVEEWTTCMTYLDPHLRSLFTKAIEVYYASKDSIRPHVVKARKMTDPYIQEARKFAEPYINQVAVVTKPHLDCMKAALKPCTKRLVGAYQNFIKSWTLYHGQVQEILKNHQLTKSLATTDLAWFAATALLSLPVIILLQLLSALFSRKTAKHAHSSRTNHTRRRGKRHHPNY
ncbi:hypothetical protein SLE2022_272640 [Rubroshorea leprosula]